MIVGGKGPPGAAGAAGADGAQGVGFDVPAGKRLTAWWRADFDASPWSGYPSVGPSHNRDIVNAINPATVGAVLNGYRTASFDGVANSLTNAVTTAGYWSDVNAMGLAILFKPAAVVATVNDDADPKLIGDSASNWGLAITSDGTRFEVSISGVGAVESPYVSTPNGSWVLVRCKMDGTKLYIAKNSAAYDAGTTITNGTALTGTLRVGQNYNGTTFYSGLIAEIMMKPTAWTAQDDTDIVSYINSRYGLSL